MPVYYDLIHGKIYVCNRMGNVSTPLGSINNTYLSDIQKKEVVDSLNAAYKAGYQTALNQLRATVDQMEVRDAKYKKRAN